LIGVVVTPLALECGSLCHAQWSVILGKSRDAPTPILNWIHESLLMAHNDYRNFMGPLWSEMPSPPRGVLIFGAIAITLGILLLRGSAQMPS
jgi:hypothetical protein